jgi:hypothetical protein
VSGSSSGKKGTVRPGLAARFSWIALELMGLFISGLETYVKSKGRLFTFKSYPQSGGVLNFKSRFASKQRGRLRVLNHLSVSKPELAQGRHSGWP